ncbi:nickel-dependent hydrogenase large subunit [archaeon]|jgi:NADH-quinone oxidoreductase subunit D|nr:nickel-dependent hydrogenase large subunit [archaeon]
MSSVPLGPLHPAFKEPINFKLKLEGELVADAEVRIGYTHRGIEKLGEKKTWIQFISISEKICGICSSSHQGCYVQGVERLTGITPEKRGIYIRTLTWELERMHSHLLWLGILMHEIGLETMFMYTWRDRERVLDVLEKLGGRRVAYSTITYGGSRRDLSDNLIQQVIRLSDFILERSKFYENFILNDKRFLARTKGIGTLTKAEAEELSVVGPVARASGVSIDVRKTGYAAYADVPFELVVEKDGDVNAGALVRVKELRVSANVIKWIVENLPQGKINIEVAPFSKLPEGEAISRVEAPRGELFYYLKSNGSTNFERIKIRTPTLANIQAVAHTLRGHYLADVPVIAAGIDPCMGCMDRVVILNEKGKEKIMTEAELVDYGIKWYERR